MPEKIGGLLHDKLSVPMKGRATISFSKQHFAHNAKAFPR